MKPEKKNTFRFGLCLEVVDPLLENADGIIQRVDRFVELQIEAKSDTQLKTIKYIYNVRTYIKIRFHNNKSCKVNKCLKVLDCFWPLNATKQVEQLVLLSALC